MPAATKPFGHLLKTLDKLIEDRFTTVLELHRLSRGQWRLLSVLAATQSTLGQLDEAMASFPDQSTRESSDVFLEPLLSGGLVAEKGGVFRLTDAGRTEYRRAREDLEGVRDATVQGLAGGEYDRTVRVLEKMIDNLTEPE